MLNNYVNLNNKYKEHVDIISYDQQSKYLRVK